MNIKKVSLLFFGLAITLIAVTAQANCEFKFLHEQIEDAQEIFVGKVISAEELPKNKGQRIKIQVTESLKGAARSIHFVTLPQKPNAHQMTAQPGDYYLVFADMDKDQDAYLADICSGTRFFTQQYLAETKAAISALENGGTYTGFGANAPFAKITLKNRKLNGTLREFSANGRLMSIQSYADGKLDGRFITYNESGGVSREAVYQNGKIISDSPVK